MRKLRVSFDFDDTICGHAAHVPHIWQILANHIRLGDEVMVLTARDPANDDKTWREAHSPNRVAVHEHLAAMGVTLQVVYTKHAPKGPFAASLGIDVHYDNDPLEIDSCRAAGILAIPVGVDHGVDFLPD